MRLSEKEGLELLENGDILELGKAADGVRRRLHPKNIVTFIVDRNINYSNVCESECRFCAFYRQKNSRDAYLLPMETILAKIKETVAAGGTQIMLQGGLHPDLGLDYYLNMLSTIKENFNITIHSFSPAEIVHMAKKAGLSLKDTLIELKAAGLDSLPGGGAEILVDSVRARVSPKKISAEKWLDVMAAAHSIGMESTATMVIGMGESYADRIAHMEKVRALQEKTGGFRAFITWTFQPGNTALAKEDGLTAKVSAWDYLKTLATTRLYLDNISHIQGSWVTQGQHIGQVTLAFGADDLGSIMLEENVVRAAGTSYEMSIQKMTDLIKRTGHKAAQRNTKYEIIKEF
jgi:cyclic dehypoxanthinyl futalosine synthase